MKTQAGHSSASFPKVSVLPGSADTAAPAAGMLTSHPLLSSVACWELRLHVPGIVGFWLLPASGRHPQKSIGQEEEAKFLLPSLTPHGCGSFPAALASSLYFPSPLLFLLLYKP